LTQTFDQAVIDELNLAISTLQSSLNPDYWVNDYHLDIINGQFVLDDSRDTVTHLMIITTLLNESQTFNDSVQSVIDNLLAADMALTQTAIDDINACGVGNNRIQNHLNNAQNKLAQAQIDSNDKKYDQAIQKFFDAWYDAFLATETCPSGYWTQLDGYEVSGP